MIKLFLKIIKTSQNTIKVDEFDSDGIKFESLGKKTRSKITHLFGGSLAIRQIDAGSDNSAEQELVALSNTFYDLERFGIHFVASPKHADMLFVTGPVTRNMAEALRRAYEATPDPKIVVAVGDDAISGGIYKGSYAIVGAVSDVLPVDFSIPGDPPSPKVILGHLLRIMKELENQSFKKK
ncbi:MAG: hypothetical protein WCV71_03125 [Patescibacteria group bacterium]|jgi:Ni,Fe-hydrogenase III small subunit